MPEHKKGAQYDQHDWNFHTMNGLIWLHAVSGWQCQLEDSNGEPTMSQMKSDRAVKFTVTKSVPLLSYCFYDFA